MMSTSAPGIKDGLHLTLKATRSSADMHLPSIPNPTLPGSTPGSPVSSNMSSQNRIINHDQQPLEHTSTSHRGYAPGAHTTAMTADSPPPPVAPSMHALCANMSLNQLPMSPSMASFPGAAPSIDGGSISGSRWGVGDGSGRPYGDTASVSSRISRSRPTLAKAGQFGLVSRGQGGSVGRLDFQLQEDFAELQWVGAFKAHFCYWKHDDVALFICRAACGYDVVDGRKEEQLVEHQPA
jgi:hypothetical protein